MLLYEDIQSLLVFFAFPFMRGEQCHIPRSGFGWVNCAVRPEGSNWLCAKFLKAFSFADAGSLLKHTLKIEDWNAISSWICDRILGVAVNSWFMQWIQFWKFFTRSFEFARNFSGDFCGRVKKDNSTCTETVGRSAEWCGWWHRLHAHRFLVVSFPRWL